MDDRIAITLHKAAWNVIYQVCHLSNLTEIQESHSHSPGRTFIGMLAHTSRAAPPAAERGGGPGSVLQMLVSITIVDRRILSHSTSAQPVPQIAA
ncbi:MAG TPA: hypothetical protein VNO30_37660 [Kofleriaceae bacterium]|nr:hypothetical protein [Kofleriaceae bacterium]